MNQRFQNPPTSIDGVELKLQKPEDIEMIFDVTVKNVKDHLDQFVPWAQKPVTLESVTQMIEEGWEKYLSGDAYEYGIYVDGKLSGAADIRNLSDTNPAEPELGYWVDKEVNGRGIATAVTNALLDLARELKIGVVIAGITPSNDASVRVVEKAGFTFREEKNGELIYEITLGSAH